MRHFKSLEAIKDADLEELKDIEGMNERAAIEVYNFFHKNNE